MMDPFHFDIRNSLPWSLFIVVIFGSFFAGHCCVDLDAKAGYLNNEFFVMYQLDLFY